MWKYTIRLYILSLLLTLNACVGLGSRDLNQEYTEIKQLQLGKTPATLLFDNINNKLYVGHRYHNYISIINLKNNELENEIPLDFSPTKLILDQQGLFLYLLSLRQDNKKLAQVIRLNLKTNETRSINLNELFYPTDGVLSIDGKELVFTAPDSTALWSVNVSNFDKNNIGTDAFQHDYLKLGPGFRILNESSGNRLIVLHNTPNYSKTSILNDGKNGSLLDKKTKKLISSFGDYFDEKISSFVAFKPKESQGKEFYVLIDTSGQHLTLAELKKDQMNGIDMEFLNTPLENKSFKIDVPQVIKLSVSNDDGRIYLSGKDESKVWVFKITNLSSYRARLKKIGVFNLPYTVDSLVVNDAGDTLATVNMEAGIVTLLKKQSFQSSKN